MTDEVDVAKRRARLQEIKQRRQTAGGKTGPSKGRPPEPLAGSPELELGAGGGNAAGRPLFSRLVNQLANLVLRWLETANEPGLETIADTAVTREGLANLMTMLSNTERRGGAGAKIALTLRAFLTRPPTQGEAVVDGVNTEQLRKLIAVASRVRDQGIGRGSVLRRRQPSSGPEPDRQGPGRFWRESGLSIKEGDDAAAELEAAFAPMDDVSGNTSEPPAGEQIGEPREDTSPNEPQRQTKRKSTGSSRKK